MLDKAKVLEWIASRRSGTNKLMSEYYILEEMRDAIESGTFDAPELAVLLDENMKDVYTAYAKLQKEYEQLEQLDKEAAKDFEEVRQLREERDEALRIASELSTELEWKIAHPVICQGICTSQADDYCGQHMSNESCIACNALWTQAHVENEIVKRNKLVKALEFYAYPANIDYLKHGYIIIDQDDGTRARTALSEIKGQGENVHD